jgi:hypothetical protein
MYADVPGDKVDFVLAFVHTTDMLFEVVQTRPDLSLVPAMFGGTLVRIFANSYAMNTFLVSLKIIDCSEAFSTGSTFARQNITHVWLVMLEHMLPELSN